MEGVSHPDTNIEEGLGDERILKWVLKSGQLPPDLKAALDCMMGKREQYISESSGFDSNPSGMHRANKRVWHNNNKNVLHILFDKSAVLYQNDLVMM